MRRRVRFPMGLAVWCYRLVVLVMLCLILMGVHRAKADVAHAVAVPVQIASALDPAGSGISLWLAGADGYCPVVGQQHWFATYYGGGAAQIVLTAPSQDWPTHRQDGCTSLSLVALRNAFWSGGLSVFGETAFLYVQPLTGGLSCEDAGGVIDGDGVTSGSGNCLADVTNTADTVAGWGWGFGVVFISGLFAFLVGSVRVALMNFLAD